MHIAQRFFYQTATNTECNFFIKAQTALKFKLKLLFRCCSNQLGTNGCNTGTAWSVLEEVPITYDFLISEASNQTNHKTEDSHITIALRRLDYRYCSLLLRDFFCLFWLNLSMVWWTGVKSHIPFCWVSYRNQAVRW